MFAAAGLAQMQTIDEFLCLLPEGCDTNGDGAPDPRAGDPVPGGVAGRGAGDVQYGNAY